MVLIPLSTSIVTRASSKPRARHLDLKFGSLSVSDMAKQRDLQVSEQKIRESWQKWLDISYRLKTLTKTGIAILCQFQHHMVSSKNHHSLIYNNLDIQAIQNCGWSSDMCVVLPQMGSWSSRQRHNTVKNGPVTKIPIGSNCLSNDMQSSWQMKVAENFQKGKVVPQSPVNFNCNNPHKRWNKKKIRRWLWFQLSKILLRGTPPRFNTCPWLSIDNQRFFRWVIAAWNTCGIEVKRIWVWHQPWSS